MSEEPEKKRRRRRRRRRRDDPDRAGFAALLPQLLTTGNLASGFYAIVMAMNDLPKMKRGTMDPRGEYLTTTGLVLAVVTLILTFMLIGFSAVDFFSFRWTSDVSPLESRSTTCLL